MADEQGSSQRPGANPAGALESKDPNWWVIGATILVGLALVIFAGNPGWFCRKSWPSVVPSVFVDFGIGLIIAAILVYLEPAFTRRIQKPIIKEVAELQNRVDNLTERTAGLLRTRDEQDDRVLAAVGEAPSFKSLTNALQRANDINALADGIATVQGGTDPPGAGLETTLSIRVRFLWGSHPAAPQPSLIVQAVCDAVPYILAHPEFTGDIDSNDRLCFQTTWEPHDEAEEVGARIVEGLRSEGLYRGTVTFEWGNTIAEFERTIGVAVASRRGGTPWGPMALFELVGDDWAITKAGVEYKYRLEFGPVFRPEDFPSFYPGGQDSKLWSQRRSQEPLAEAPSRKLLQSPPGVPQPSERLLIRAAAHLPLRDSPNTPTGWQPVRTVT